LEDLKFLPVLVSFRGAGLQGRALEVQRTGNLLISRAFGSRAKLRIGRLDDAVLELAGCVATI
jgi:hypothetical protein